MTLTGVNFGPTDTYAFADYASYRAACTVTVAHTEVQCDSVQGFGAGHTWKLTIGRQQSAASAQTTSYNAPVVVGFKGLGSPTLYPSSKFPEADELAMVGQHREQRCPDVDIESLHVPTT